MIIILKAVMWGKTSKTLLKNILTQLKFVQVVQVICSTW